MPIRLFSLPPHVRISAIQKLGLSDFVNFQQSSRESFAESKEVKTRFTVEVAPDYAQLWPWLLYSSEKGKVALHRPMPFMTALKSVHLSDFSDIPVRFEGCCFTLRDNFTVEFCKELIKFVVETNSTMGYLNFRGFDCSPCVLKELAETRKIKQLIFTRLLSPAYINIEVIRNISKYELAHLDQTEIFNLNVLRFTVFSSNITSAGINRILKEVLDGSRSLSNCHVGTNQPLVENVILEGIFFVKNSERKINIGIGPIYEITIRDSHIVINKMPQLSKPEKRCVKRQASDNSSIAKRVKQ